MATTLRLSGAAIKVVEVMIGTSQQVGLRRATALQQISERSVFLYLPPSVHEMSMTTGQYGQWKTDFCRKAQKIFVTKIITMLLF
jgi:hypothetical protein